MTTFHAPDIHSTAVALNGQLTCLIDGVAYQRTVRSLIVKCSSPTAVNVYQGMVSDPALIATNRLGSNNTYSPINLKIIPSGFPIFVVFPDANPANDTAQAVLSCDGDY